jgi:hypothetical protein
MRVRGPGLISVPHEKAKYLELNCLIRSNRAPELFHRRDR